MKSYITPRRVQLVAGVSSLAGVPIVLFGATGAGFSEPIKYVLVLLLVIWGLEALWMGLSRKERPPHTEPMARTGTPASHATASSKQA